MPRRWILILRDHADAARPIRAADCHGLINRWWPQPTAEHAAAKQWAMNGWPEAIGDRLKHWSITWLDDRHDPPVLPTDLIGTTHRIGDHSVELLSITEVSARGYSEIMDHPATAVARDTAVLYTRSPAVTLGTERDGTKTLAAWPSPRQLFGFVHRQEGGRFGGSGALGVVARFAPSDLAEPWLARIDAVITDIQRSLVPDCPVRLVEAAGPRDRQVVGWTGAFRLKLTSSSGVREFAALLALVELAGVGKYTAQGFGAVRVDTVTVAAT